jgi:hypothetical protein
MSQAHHQIDYVFHGGPLTKWLDSIGWNHSHGRTKHLCALFALATWAVIAILSALQGTALTSSLKIPFLFDISEAVRFLIVGPMLIAAEPIISPWLRHVVLHFKEMVPDNEMAEFKKHVDDAARYRDLWWIELLLLGFALTRQHIDSSILILHDVSSWQMINGHPSWAQYYSAYVAKPLMGWLWLRWLWKYVVWSLLLCRIAPLHLKLIPTHPDDTAGLGFVAAGQTKFAIIVVALSMLVMSASADEIFFEGATFMAHKWIVLWVVCLALIIFCTPLLAFTPKLIETKRRGLFEYGRLAQEYVDKFDTKWIDNRKDVKEEILGHGDIQTLADMESAYSIVQRMKVFVIDRSMLMTFALAAALPFAPLVLTMFSLEDIVEHFFKNLL